MNETVREALFYFDVDAADLSSSERSEVIETIETNIINNFYKGKLLWQIPDLLPEAYRRFIESRIKP